MRQILRELHKISADFDYSQIEKLLLYFDTSKNLDYVGFGAGRMGYALRSFMMRLFHLGYNSYMIGDTNFPRISDKTITIVNSSSGETESNILYAKQARNNGSYVVLFTTNSNSSIAKLSDFTICYSSIDSKQLMKSVYEQFTFLLFDYITENIKNKYGLSTSVINSSHSISIYLVKYFAGPPKPLPTNKADDLPSRYGINTRLVL